MKSSIYLLLLLHLSLTVFSQQKENKPKLIIPFGHQLGIRHTLFSRDNRFLVTADEKITIISDVLSGKPLAYLKGSNPAMSNNGKIVTTFADSLVYIWATDGGELIKTYNADSKVVKLTLNPDGSQLLIQKYSGESAGNESYFPYDIILMDITRGVILKTFESQISGESPTRPVCDECDKNYCPIYGAWFSPSGDSLRILYRTLIKSYHINNLENANSHCLFPPGNRVNPEEVSVLNNNMIKVAAASTGYYFTESGNMYVSYPINEQEVNSGTPSGIAEVVSPALNYAVRYTGNVISLRDLKTAAVKTYQAEGAGIKKITFNTAGTYALVEFLNEKPRIFALPVFTDAMVVSEKEFIGFPSYVYETKTLPDAESATAFIDSVDARLPKVPPAAAKAGRLFGIMDPMQGLKQLTGEMKKDINSSYTNSGEIVNLRTNRTISKIQSLIKLSGDIRLSADKQLMLLNTGKILTLYSIPYARVLFNMKNNGNYTAFSPDSRWLVLFQPPSKLLIIDIRTGRPKAAELKFTDKGEYTLHFSPDSRELTVRSLKGGFATIDIASAGVSQQINKSIRFESESHDKYGIINPEQHIAEIYSSQDKVKISNIDLSVKKSQRSQREEENWQISFSRGKSIAIWCNRRVIYVKDVSNPADTIQLIAEKGENFSDLQLSPGGQYFLCQVNNRVSVLINPLNISHSAALYTKPAEITEAEPIEDEQPISIGASMRNAMAGNIEGLLGKRNLTQFSITGDSVLICKDEYASIYRTADATLLNNFKTPGEVKYFSFSGDLLISYFFGQLIFSRISDDGEWFSMIPFTNDETVFLLPNGVYAGSKSATRHLNYLYDAKSLSYKQLDFNNNRPDIVLRQLGNTDARYLAIYDSLAMMRRRREGLSNTRAINFDHAPAVTISNDDKIPGEVKTRTLSIDLHITSDSQPLSKLAVYINGNPVGGRKNIPLSKTTSKDTSLNLELSEGSNTIEISAFNLNGTEGYRRSLYIYYTPVTPSVKTVYFAGMGAGRYAAPGKTLYWTGNDIREIVTTLSKTYGTDLKVDTIFDRQVVADNVKKMKTGFRNARPDDIVVVYYSGHGEVDFKKSEAYFGTYDMDFNNPSTKGVSFTELNNLLEDIPVRNKVLFIDACHSGELNKEANHSSANVTNAAGTMRSGNTSGSLYNTGDASAANFTDPFDLMLELFNDLYQGNGTNIVVAARGTQAAKECNEIEHGVFTYTVLNGLSGLRADLDSNRILTIGELNQFVTKNVPVYSASCDSNYVQRSAVRKENEFNDWAILYDSNAAISRHTVFKEVHPESAPAVQVINTIDDIKKSNPLEILKGNGSPQEKGGVLTKGVDKLKKIFGKKDNNSVLESYSKKDHKNATTLFNADGLIIRYELQKEHIIFEIVCAGYVPSIAADVNSNAGTDGCQDIVYKRDIQTNDICVQYISAVDQNTVCNADSPTCGPLKSDAAIKVSGNQYFFLIPKGEISTTKTGHVRFNFLNIDTGKSMSQPPATGNNIFEKTFDINLN